MPGVVPNTVAVVFDVKIRDRTLWQLHAKVKAADGNYELKPKADRSTTSTPTPKVNRLDVDAKMYLSEDEYKTFAKLMAKIEYNRQVKALEAEIAALEAKKQELLKGGNE